MLEADRAALPEGRLRASVVVGSPKSRRYLLWLASTEHPVRVCTEAPRQGLACCDARYFECSGPCDCGHALCGLRGWLLVSGAIQVVS